MRDNGSIGHAVLRCAALVACAGLTGRNAYAASVQLPPLDPLMSSLTFASVGVFVWAFLVIRRLAGSEAKARKRLSDMEVRLNEAESAFAAEAHVMVVWHSKQDTPNRLIGSMYGSANVPQSVAELLDFPAWLEPDSSGMIGAGVNALRYVGKAFNIGVRTTLTDLLYADGLMAGRIAKLRFRPLSG